jgi:hypothetical protein
MFTVLMTMLRKPIRSEEDAEHPISNRPSTANGSRQRYALPHRERGFTLASQNPEYFTTHKKPHPPHISGGGTINLSTHPM